MSLLVVGALVFSACGGEAAPVESVATSTTTVSAQPSPCTGVDFRARVGVYDAAQRGEIDPATPSTLGPATAAVPPGLFTGVLYGGCASEFVNGMGHELMLWTNGIGVLVVAWQEWPDDGPLRVMPFGGEDDCRDPASSQESWGCTRQAGVVQVSAMDYQEPDVAERTRVVHLYDGRRVVTVATYDLTTMSVEQAEEVAWAVYDALPSAERSPDADVPQRTFDDLVAAVPSDTVSVSGIEDAPTLSPFMTSLAIPTVTRRFIAAGSTVTAFDFGAAGAADRAAAAIASDGYTIGRQPYEIVATPRYWRWDRVILQYLGDDPELLARLVEVLGQPFAGPEIVSIES